MTALDARILVIGDDLATRDPLVEALADQGWQVEGARSGDEGLDAATRFRPDLILLDLVEPSDEGLEMLVRARRHGSTPIVILVQRADMVNLLFGLAFGAVDYIGRPASPEEVVDRVRTVLLTGAHDSARHERLVFTGLVVDRSSREVFVDGALVETTAKEFDLLAFLAGSPRRVFSRAELLERVWGSSMGWQRPSTVTEHVRRLRTKIEPDPRQPRWIVTVRGVGYRFEPR